MQDVFQCFLKSTGIVESFRTKSREYDNCFRFFTPEWFFQNKKKVPIPCSDRVKKFESIFSRDDFSKEQRKQNTVLQQSFVWIALQDKKTFFQESVAKHRGSEKKSFETRKKSMKKLFWEQEMADLKNQPFLSALKGKKIGKEVRSKCRFPKGKRSNLRFDWDLC
jgi:hypothetical protein